MFFAYGLAPVVTLWSSPDPSDLLILVAATNLTFFEQFRSLVGSPTVSRLFGKTLGFILNWRVYHFGDFGTLF